MKGAQSAAANGHPRIPAAANQNMPWEVLRPPFQFMKAAAPSVTKYMAKLDGRKAVLAWKFPGLAMVPIRKKRPIRLLSVVLVTIKRIVCVRAHTKASPKRTK